MQAEYTFTRFEQACAKYPDHTAIIFLGEKFSYRGLKDMVDRFATGLAGLGIKQGDRIVIYLSNSVQLVIAFLAAQKIGAPLCSFPPSTRPTNSSTWSKTPVLV